MNDGFKKRLGLALRYFIILWAGMWFLAGYYGGVRGIETGIQSGLVVAGIAIAVAAFTGAILFLVFYVLEGFDKKEGGD